MDINTRTDIRRLTKERAQPTALSSADVPAPVQSQTGMGQAQSAGSGSGISSPLTETSRVTYDTQSSDGIFTWSVPDTITFVDAAGREVVLDFATP